MPASDPPASAGVDDPEVPVAAEPVPVRERKVVLVSLESTPTGAIALVDGVMIGNTPTHWQGEANGCVHEFRFELPGYKTPRYRFVPVQDGFVHGKLERIPEGDGGVPELPAVDAIAPCPTRAPATRSRRTTPRPAPPLSLDAMPATPPDDAARPSADASPA